MRFVSLMTARFLHLQAEYSLHKSSTAARNEYIMVEYDDIPIPMCYKPFSWKYYIRNEKETLKNLYFIVTYASLSRHKDVHWVGRKQVQSAQNTAYLTVRLWTLSMYFEYRQLLSRLDFYSHIRLELNSRILIQASLSIRHSNISTANNFYLFI